MCCYWIWHERKRKKLSLNTIEIIMLMRFRIESNMKWKKQNCFDTHTLPKVCLISDLFFLHFSLLIYLFITNRFDLAFWCGDLHTNTPKLQASAAVTYRLFVFVFSIFDVCFEFHLYSIRLRICFLQRYQLQMSEYKCCQIIEHVSVDVNKKRRKKSQAMQLNAVDKAIKFSNTN